MCLVDLSTTTQDKSVFLFLHILEIIDYIFRKIITLNEVNI